MALRLFCGVAYAGGEFVLFHFLNRVITHDPSAIVRAHLRPLSPFPWVAPPSIGKSLACKWYG